MDEVPTVLIDSKALVRKLENHRFGPTKVCLFVTADVTSPYPYMPTDVKHTIGAESRPMVRFQKANSVGSYLVVAKFNFSGCKYDHHFASCCLL